MHQEPCPLPDCTGVWVGRAALLGHLLNQHYWDDMEKEFRDGEFSFRDGKVLFNSDVLFQSFGFVPSMLSIKFFKILLDLDSF